MSFSVLLPSFYFLKNIAACKSHLDLCWKISMYSFEIFLLLGQNHFPKHSRSVTLDHSILFAWVALPLLTGSIFCRHNLLILLSKTFTSAIIEVSYNSLVLFAVEHRFLSAGGSFIFCPCRNKYNVFGWESEQLQYCDSLFACSAGDEEYHR